MFEYVSCSQEDSGLAGDLIDGLNMEDDFRTNTPAPVQVIKRNLLVEDALFLVSIDSPSLQSGSQALPSGDPDSRQILPNYSSCKDALCDDHEVSSFLLICNMHSPCSEVIVLHFWNY